MREKSKQVREKERKRRIRKKSKEKKAYKYRDISIEYKMREYKIRFQERVKARHEIVLDCEEPLDHSRAMKTYQNPRVNLQTRKVDSVISDNDSKILQNDFSYFLRSFLFNPYLTQSRILLLYKTRSFQLSDKDVNCLTVYYVF